jgi:hypothetical protein
MDVAIEHPALGVGDEPFQVGFTSRGLRCIKAQGRSFALPVSRERRSRSLVKERRNSRANFPHSILESILSEHPASCATSRRRRLRKRRVWRRRSPIDAPSSSLIPFFDS